MKKLIVLCILCFAVVFVIWRTFTFIKLHVKRDLALPLTYPTLIPTPTISQHPVTSQVSLSLFVPYWTLDTTSKLPSYQQYVYFGVSTDASGMLQKDAAMGQLKNFTASISHSTNTLLVLRMIDSDSNIAILKDTKVQQELIAQMLSLAKKHGFDGIALDLELQALPFDSIIDQINMFTANFYQQASKQHLVFTVIVYGDTFFRLRPFDIKTLAHNTDQIMVMAYDFSKSRGDPGPNFPMHGKEIYGYDLTKMADDFLQYVPPEKFAVIFGMFGYDWQVDSKGNAGSNAQALTDNQIQKKFLNNCALSDCLVHHDDIASETEVTYIDLEKRKHIVWFEDTKSASMKQKYLQERGISHFGYWANSYF